MKEANLEQIELQKKILEIQRKIGKEGLKQSAEATKMIARLQEIVKLKNSIHNSGFRSLQNEIQSTQNISNIYSEIKSSQREVASMSNEIGSVLLEMVSAPEQFSQADREQAQLMDDILNGYAKQASLARELSQLTVDDVDKHHDINKELSVYEQKLSEQIGKLDEKNKLGSEFLSISRKIGEKTNEQLEAAHRLSTISESEKQSLEKRQQMYDDIAEGLDNFVGTLIKKFGTVQGAIGGVLMVGGKLLDSVGEVNKSLGTSITNLNEATASAGALSLVFDNTAETVKGLTSEFGQMSKATLSVQTNIGLISKTMGISSSEAVQLTGIISRMKGETLETSANVMATARAFAQQEGVIPSALLSDMASHADLLAVNAGRGADNFLKMAAGAQKLGTNLSAMEAVQSNLLDFETSMSKELELSAMLGKNINLNRARQLAQSGDLEGMMRETLRSVGGIHEFEKMNYQTRKMTADLLGVSVSEFQKMAKNAENVSETGKVTESTFSKMGATIETLVNEKLGVGVGVLGGWLTTTAQLGANFKMMGFSLGGIVKKIGSIPGLGKLKSLGDKLHFGGGKGSETIGKGTSSFMESIGKIDMKKVLQGALAMAIVAGAVWGFGKAVQEFTKVKWDDVGKAVVGMLALTGAVIALGIAMSSGVGELAILAGAGAMLVVASAMWVLGKAVQELSIGFDALGKVETSISSLVSDISGIFQLSAAFMTLAGSLTAVGIASMISLPALTGLSLVTDVLGSVIGPSEPTTSLESDSVSEFHNNVLDKMDELINVMKQKTDVYMDAEKVTNVVMRQSEKSSANMFGLKYA